MKTIKVEDLGNYKTHMARLHDQLDDLEIEFKKIQTLFDHDVSDGHFSSAISSFYFIFDFVPLMSQAINPGEIDLFPARINQKNILFNTAAEISYNKSRPDLVEAGRFNQPKQPVFYASLPVEKGVVPPYYAACLETCKDLTDPDSPVSLMDFTVGRWKVSNSFYVINFCFDSMHLKYSPGLEQAVNAYLNGLKVHMTGAAFDFVRRFMHYFSEMSGRQTLKKREYYILTALFYAIRFYYKEHLKTDIDGLVFAGAGTEKKGLNIVVMPQCADQCLELDVVMMLRFEREEQEFKTEKSSNMVYAKDGRFLIDGFCEIPNERFYG